jgi:hypothetical protein
MQRYTVYFVWKLLYMFRVVPPPIIRIANNCIYSIWVFVTLLLLSAAIVEDLELWQAVVTVWQIPDAADRIVWAPNDGWWYHPKHVEQFPDKINCVTSHLVGYILEYKYFGCFQGTIPRKNTYFKHSIFMSDDGPLEEPKHVILQINAIKNSCDIQQ